MGQGLLCLWQNLHSLVNELFCCLFWVVLLIIVMPEDQITAQFTTLKIHHHTSQWG